jgi:hypothetical protein
MKKENALTKLLNIAIVKAQLALQPARLRDMESLITKNRLDINLRIKFLEDVVGRKKKFNKTRYYRFVGIPRGDGLNEDPEAISRQFIELYEDIRKNGFNGHFIVAKTNRFNHEEIVFRDHREVSNKKIEFKYQLVGGAHRFAACRFLGYKKIPVKIIRTPFLNFPNMTSFIKRYKI